MKMKKRFLSILLSLVMVLGLMPGMSLTAYAEASSGTIGNASVKLRRPYLRRILPMLKSQPQRQKLIYTIPGVR